MCFFQSMLLLTTGISGWNLSERNNYDYDYVNGGSNYDSLIVRTVAFPVQVAYWIKRS